jgi:BirA family biotin operon repressor/biotin-[acetyl-CoA-carboxylase] ligase
MGRKWHTHPGAALAFSLILHLSNNEKPDIPFPFPEAKIPLLTAWGAMAVSDALYKGYKVMAEIKWPNDVLVGGRKVSGVLVEVQWQGERPTTAVLGIGINVAPQSLPPDMDFLFPATCVESTLGRSIDRWVLLHTILESLLAWRLRLSSVEFLEAWESRLAFRDEWVQVISQESDASVERPQEGQIIGLSPEGYLKLRTRSQDILSLRVGDIHLRPVDRTQK